MESVPKAFVVGHPVGHSRSPMIQTHWLDTLGIAGSYEAVDVAPEDLADFLRTARGRGFVGGNVTIPHKEAAFALVEEASEVARRLGAVNTLVLGPEGRLVGHNTDVDGFTAGLDDAVGPDWPAGVVRALVVGAGGAARAVVAGLLQRGVGHVLVANRRADRADSVKRLAPTRIDSVAFDALDAHLGTVDLLVNATPLGMAGQPPLPVRVDDLPANAIVADIVYVPLETPLLAAAAARGLRVADGLGMLLHQAVPGFRAWFGKTPEVTAELRARVAADIARAG